MTTENIQTLQKLYIQWFTARLFNWSIRCCFFTEMGCKCDFTMFSGSSVQRDPRLQYMHSSSCLYQPYTYKVMCTTLICTPACGVYIFTPDVAHASQAEIKFNRCFTKLSLDIVSKKNIDLQNLLQNMRTFRVGETSWLTAST